MEFGSELQEKQHVNIRKVKINPFSPYSSSSSSSSSSLTHNQNQKKPNLVSLAHFYENNHHQMGSWLATKYQDTDTSTTTTAKLDDFMDINVNDDEDQKVEEEHQRGGGGGEELADPIPIEKEHMFDKVVTPSDVGKLNRLVIPKQHAEKYFPLDSTINEKGLLLNFEDRTNKVWRFRYSYWNSSQSYVMTKGWSRFVKDKKLDAGDIVSFQRGRLLIGTTESGGGGNNDIKLYIDWRRRPDTTDHHHQYSHQQHHQQQQHHYLSSIPWSPLLMRPPPPATASMGMIQREHLYSSRNGGIGNIGSSGSSSANYYGYNNNSCSNSSSTGTIVYMRSAVPPQMVHWQEGGNSRSHHHHHHHHHVDPIMNMVYESVPVVQGNAAAKRLRLFGVNMDCPITSSEEEEEECHDHHHQSSVQLKLFTTGTTPIHKPNSTSSSSMSLDLGI